MKEFTRIYRPKRLDQVVGQADAVRILSKWLEDDDVPHAVMLHGPSGCGKTTLARILRRELGASLQHDFAEYNCADTRGIDTIREIRRMSGLSPVGKCRMCLLDEAHKLSNDAQNALLKMVEDPPEDMYYILCTTEPGKLIKTLQTRCSPVAVRSFTHKELYALAVATWAQTKNPTELASEVIEALVEASDGSARQLLTLMHQVAQLKTKEQQLSAISRADHKSESVMIARALIDTKTTWRDMAKVLRECDIEEPEKIRHLVLVYCTRVLLGGKPNLRAAMVIDYFRGHFYDSKKAGLIHACFEVVGSK